MPVTRFQMGIHILISILRNSKCIVFFCAILDWKSIQTSIPSAEEIAGRCQEEDVEQVRCYKIDQESGEFFHYKLI